MRSLKAKTISVLLILLLSVPALADRQRTALVIGNADYQEAPLRNPVNDARSVAAKLQSRGFQVTSLLNADQRTMEEAIRKFVRRLQPDTVGLFYFAGHGLEIDGENYLIPVDARIEIESDVKYEAVAVGRLLDGMQRSENGLNLVVLDACRNNPYSRRFRGASRGLAEMRPASGTLILYATEPGNVAADGDGKNGVFTEQLLKSIDRPGLDVEAVFKETALAVNKLTKGRQIPWYEGVILGYFYFIPTASEKLVPENQPQVPPLSVDDSALTQDEIFNVFSNKTVEGYHHKNEVEFKRYYAPDGTLLMRNITAGKSKTTRWKALNGQLCHYFGRMKCARVAYENGDYRLYDPFGNLAVSFRNFKEGNQLD